MIQIRPIAICVFRNKDHILVFEGIDPDNGKIFYRPLGGGIEFGGRSEDTARRELKEEINVDVGDLKYLGTLENIYAFNKYPYHEIVRSLTGCCSSLGYTSKL